MLVTEDLHRNFKIHHLHGEHNSVGKNKTIDSPDLINLDSDHSFQAALYNSIGCDGSCDAPVDSLVNNKGRIQNRTHPSTVDSVESLRSSGTELVYCEIPDIRGNCQVDSEGVPKENQLLAHVSSAQGCVGVSGFVKSASDREREREQVRKQKKPGKINKCEFVLIDYYVFLKNKW